MYLRYLALFLDPKTEQIHFYLSLVHSKMGNIDLSLKHKELSKSLNEYNDSIFELQ